MSGTKKCLPLHHHKGNPEETDEGDTIYQTSQHCRTNRSSDLSLRVPAISAYTRWNCLATTYASKSRSTPILIVRCSFQRVYASGQFEAAELNRNMITKPKRQQPDQTLQLSYRCRAMYIRTQDLLQSTPVQYVLATSQVEV